MPLIFDSGTEMWVPWAKRKAAELRAMRTRLGLPKLQRAWSPASGVLVWAQSTRFGELIRITGGRGYRAWHVTPVSVHVKGTSLKQTKLYQPADWDRGVTTFARSTTFDTVLERAGTTTTLAGTDPVPFWTTFYHPTHAMTRDGTTAIVVASWRSVGTGALSPTRCAVVAKWSEDLQTFVQTDVPYPPGFVSAACITDFTTASGSVASGPYYLQAGADATVTVTFPAITGTNGTMTFTPPENPRVFVFADYHRMDKVYVDVRYWVAGSPSTLRDTTAFTPPSAPGGIAWCSHSSVHQVWSYDIATAEWTLVHDRPARTSTKYLSINHSDGFSYGAPGPQGVSIANHEAWEPVIDPYLGLRIVSCDNRVLPEVSTPTTITLGAVSVTPSLVADATRSSSAPYLIDADTWFPSVTGLSTAGLGSATPRLADISGPSVAQVGESRRGALSNGLWRWGEANEAVLPLDTNPSPLFNKPMNRAYADAGAGTRSWVYEDGVVLYDGTTDTTMSAAPYVYRVSYDNPTRAFAQVFYLVPAPPATPAHTTDFHLAEGVMDVDGEGSFAIAQSGYNGIYNDGGVLTLVTYDASFNFVSADTEADLTDIWGTTVTLTVTGPYFDVAVVFPEIPSPGPSTRTSQEVAEFTSGSHTTKYEIPLSLRVPTVDPDVDVIFTPDKMVPDECVLKPDA